MKFTLELLKAEHTDSTGERFTRECLKDAAARAADNQLLVKASFDKAHDEVLGKVTNLVFIADTLFADIELLDTPGGHAAGLLVADKRLELAAGGHVQVAGEYASTIEGGVKTHHALTLTDTALVMHKVK